MYSANESSTVTAQTIPSTVCFTVSGCELPSDLQPEARAFLRNLDDTEDASHLPQWLAKALDKFHADQFLSAAFLIHTSFCGLPLSCKVDLMQKGAVCEKSETLVRLTALREKEDVKPDGTPLSSDLYRLENFKVTSELAAGVSHEIRNPMTSVRGFLQMLSTKEALKEYRSHFSLMIEELDRANAIITQYLTLAKNKPQPAEPKNLCDIVRKLQPLLESSALLTKKTLRLALAPVPDLPLNDKEIYQILLNLVKNGFEAMEPDKTLTIGTRADADSVVLFVQDEGSGIPASALEKIGEPFFTTKENGTGLGLPICYALARHNQAEIQIASSEEGTTFSLVFQAPPASQV